MAAPNRWAVREAAEVTFYSLTTSSPIVTLNTLKMTEVQTTGETVYSMGGRGNAKLVGFSGNREAKVTMQDAIFDNAAMAMLTGNPIYTGAKDIQVIETLTVVTGLKVTLKETPTGVASVEVYPYSGGILGTKLTTPTLNLKDLTLTGVAIGDTVRVFYKTSKADSKVITVNAANFGGTFRMVADVLVKDELTSALAYGQFIAPKAKIEDDFTFSFSPDGDPSVLDIPIELLKDTVTGNMWELVLYG